MGTSNSKKKLLQMEISCFSDYYTLQLISICVNDKNSQNMVKYTDKLI